MSIRSITAAIVFLFAIKSALAADVSGFDEGASYHIAEWLQPQLFRLGVWSLGIKRINDTMFISLMIILSILSMASSAIGLIIYRSKGLSFRPGWFLSFIVIMFSSIIFSKYRSYPSIEDIPYLAVFVTISALVMLGVAAVVKTIIVMWFDNELSEPGSRRKIILNKRIKAYIRR